MSWLGSNGERPRAGASPVRKATAHFQPDGEAGRLDLAIELTSLFAKGLTDKLFRSRADAYVRNHFLRIDPRRLPAFQARLHAAVRELAEEFDAGEDDGAEHVRVLVVQVGDG